MIPSPKVHTYSLPGLDPPTKRKVCTYWSTTSNLGCSTCRNLLCLSGRTRYRAGYASRPLRGPTSIYGGSWATRIFTYVCFSRPPTQRESDRIGKEQEGRNSRVLEPSSTSLRHRPWTFTTSLQQRRKYQR